MNIYQQDLIIKCIAAVAWADGKLEKSEIDYLMRAIDKMGYEDKSKAREILENSKTIPDTEDIKDLPEAVRVQMLQFMWLMATVDNKTSKKEMDIVKAISLVTFKDWKPVKKWLEAYAEFIKQGKKLFANEGNLL